MSAARLLEVEGLHTHFLTKDGRVRAVDGVSFKLEHGRTLGLVGESGSGKSMLGRTLIDILPRDGSVESFGRIALEGRDLRALAPNEMRNVRGREIAMIFQDPSTALNPVKRVGEQIAETIRRHLRLGRRAANESAVELLGAVGLPSPRQRARDYPHHLSGGMRQRVAIAIAVSAEPKLLIADEPTTALDVTIQAQILDLLSRLCAERDMGLILISHDLGVVSGYADDVAVMYAGQLVESGPAPAVLRDPRMRYTVSLMRSVPSLHGTPHAALEVIRGRPPVLLNLPDGCRFYARCTSRLEGCEREAPASVDDDGHQYSCWNPLVSRGRAR